MRFSFPRALAAALLAASVLPLGACANMRKHTGADTQYVARDVGTLYNLAKKQLDAGDYANAAAISTRSSASILIRSGPAAPS
jgi:outer membrane protein assembly factor BamD